MADEKTEDALEACQETVEELKAENDDLREAADTFGELAERLNRALHPERGQEAVVSGDAKPDNGLPACPRCGRSQHVRPTPVPPSGKGEPLHCDYCGNSWH
jgi:hypothetical protein